MIGYMFKMGLNLHLGYELGLVNNAPSGSDYTSKNTVVSINIGYSIAALLYKKSVHK
jgi:hypothetical protein